MKPRQSWLIRILALSAVLAAWLLPTGTASAKICYDASKNIIPCPKSDYELTQEALKSAGLSATPVPDTATFTAVPSTATNTPVPATSTNTPTATSTETSTPTAAAAAASIAATVTPMVLRALAW